MNEFLNALGIGYLIIGVGLSLAVVYHMFTNKKFWDKVKSRPLDSFMGTLTLPFTWGVTALVILFEGE